MESIIDKNIVHKINKSLHLTDDIISNTPIITILGNKGVSIENYKKIKAFNSDITVIETLSGDIEIEGTRLYLECCYEDEIVIRGKIIKISLNNGRDKA